MTRSWGALIEDIQDALKAAVEAEQEANAGELPAALQAGKFAVVLALDRDRRLLMPTGILILPPAPGEISLEVTSGFEGRLTFPVQVTVRNVAPPDLLVHLREAVGLVVDAMKTQLNDSDSDINRLAAFDDPFIGFSPIETDGGEARQELQVRFVLREDE